MSEQNEKLTATSIKSAWSDWNDAWAYRDSDPTTFDAFKSGAEWLAQQVEHATAELREECEQLGKLLTTANGAIKYQKDKAEGLRKELNATAKGLERWSNKWAKKNVETLNLRSEIDNLKADKKLLNDQISVLKHQLAEAQRHRNEARNKHVELSRLIKSIRPWMAEEFHRHDYKSMWDIWQFLLSRLSSGETNHPPSTDTK